MSDEAAKPEVQEAPKAKKSSPKTVRVRSKVGDFLILSTNTKVAQGAEVKVEMDPWLQRQIDADKLEIVTD